MTDFGKSILESAVRDHPESIPAKRLLENFHHFVNIHEVLNGKWEWGWGSYMFNGLKYIWQRETLKKQEALFRVGEKSKNALEIGVYLGHSLLILLISNPDLKITEIFNADLRYEFFPGKGQLFSTSLFYKNFKNPIEIQALANNSNKYQNAASGRNFGILHCKANLLMFLMLVYNI